MAPDPVAGIDLIGVRFDGMGRSPGQAGAPQALRAAGLETALPAADLTSDVIVPAPASARGPAGFINEAALLKMAGTVCSRVGHSLRAGRFPLLYGADCAVLPGAVPALRDTAGRAGLLFTDAHEDATAMEQPDTGEAASMEIALLLGLTGTRAGTAAEPASGSGPGHHRHARSARPPLPPADRRARHRRPGSAAPPRGTAR